MPRRAGTPLSSINQPGHLPAAAFCSRLLQSTAFQTILDHTFAAHLFTQEIPCALRWRDGASMPDPQPPAKEGVEISSWRKTPS